MEKILSEIVRKLREIDTKTIILLGSYAQAAQRIDSDIDLIVVLDSDMVPASFEERFAKEIARQKEEKRRKKWKGKLTDRELEKLNPVEVTSAIQERTWIGTFILQTNRLDLSSQQIHQL